MYDFVHFIQLRAFYFTIGPLVSHISYLWLFFTIVSLLMKFTTVLITYLHALTAYYERNKSYIMQLFKKWETVKWALLFFVKLRKKIAFCLDMEKFWKVFLSLEKCFHRLAIILRGRPQRTSAAFRGGGGTQLQTFADMRGGGVPGMQTSAFS